MKYNKFTCLALLILLTCANAIGQQKPPYSQYMFNLFLLNPAAAGSEGFTSFNLTAREQWVGLANTPKTHSLSVQTRVLKNSFIARALNLRKKFGKRSKSGRVGVGAYIYNDFSGPISRTGMQYTYAYHIPLRQSQLSFGLALENYYYKINKDWLSQNLLNEDPIINSKLHRFTIDGNFGVQFTTPFLYSGISVSDLFQSNLNFGDSVSRALQVGRHYWVTAGYKIELNRFFMLEPSTLMKISELGAFQIDLTAKAYYREDYWFGLSYRSAAYGGSVIFLAGIRHNKYYFGYAFDLTLSPIMKHTLGTHELMLSIKFGENARRYRWLNRY